MRYSLNPELATILKKSWNEIGLSEEVQDNLLELMDIAAIAIRKRNLAVLPNA
jgi:hypothetical protein